MISTNDLTRKGLEVRYSDNNKYSESSLIFCTTLWPDTPWPGQRRETTSAREAAWVAIDAVDM